MTFLTRTRSLLLLIALVPLLARPAIGWSLVQCVEGAPCAVHTPASAPQGCCHATAAPQRPLPTGDCCVSESAPPVQFVQVAAVQTPRPLLFVTFDRPPAGVRAVSVVGRRADPAPGLPPLRPFAKQGRGARPPPVRGLHV